MASSSKRHKTSVKITPAQRVNEFGADKLYVEGDALWCKVCNVAVDHVRRQTIVDHMDSKKHTGRLSARHGETSAVRQSTITGCV